MAPTFGRTLGAKPDLTAAKTSRGATGEAPKPAASSPAPHGVPVPERALRCPAVGSLLGARWHTRSAAAALEPHRCEITSALPADARHLRAAIGCHPPKHPPGEERDAQPDHPRGTPAVPVPRNHPVPAVKSPFFPPKRTRWFLLSTSSTKPSQNTPKFNIPTPYNPTPRRPPQTHPSPRGRRSRPRPIGGPPNLGGIFSSHHRGGDRPDKEHVCAPACC